MMNKKISAAAISCKVLRKRNEYKKPFKICSAICRQK